MSKCKARRKAMQTALELLNQLSDPFQSPNVPRWVREKARGLLPDFPTKEQIDGPIFGPEDVSE